MNDKYFDPIVHDALREEIDREQWIDSMEQEQARKEGEAMDWFRSYTKTFQDQFIVDAVIAYLESEGYWDGKR